MWGKATVWHGQSAGASPRLFDQFLEQLLGVLRRGGALQPALHILPVPPTDVLDVVGVVAPAVGAFPSMSKPLVRSSVTPSMSG